MTTNRKRKGRRTFGATRQLPSGRWQASYLAPDGSRRRAPQTFAAAADANAWLSSVEHSVSVGNWRPPELAQESFGAYGGRWLAQRVDLRPRTRELYDLLWRRWLEPDLGTVALADMTVDTWRAWYLRKRAEHPGSTQPDKAYRLARAMLNTAVDDDQILPSNPCRVKGAGTEHAPERPTVAPDQVEQLANAIDPQYRVMVLLAAYRVFRFGELAGLRRRRVDLLHGTVTIEEQAVELAGGRVEFGPPKTEAGRRTVALPPTLATALREHLDAYVAPGPDALLFTSPEGHPLRRTKFRPRWAAACSAVGITGLHFHDLRGSGLTWSAHLGATVAELQHLAGHTTPAVAMRYQHATIERDRANADKLDTLMRAASAVAPPAVAEVVDLPR
jgi:integrase